MARGKKYKWKTLYRVFERWMNLFFFPLFFFFSFSIFAKYVATIEHELDIWRAPRIEHPRYPYAWSKNGASKEINFESSSSLLSYLFSSARVADTFDRLNSEWTFPKLKRREFSLCAIVFSIFFSSRTVENLYHQSVITEDKFEIRWKIEINDHRLSSSR